MIGVMQAIEAVKLIVGIGEPLIGRLVHFDALTMKFREFKLRRDPKCPVCGEHPTITELIDYEVFCGVPQAPAAEEKRDAVPAISESRNSSASSTRRRISCSWTCVRNTNTTSRTCPIRKLMPVGRIPFAHERTRQRARDDSPLQERSAQRAGRAN